MSDPARLARLIASKETTLDLLHTDSRRVPLANLEMEQASVSGGVVVLGLGLTVAAGGHSLAVVGVNVDQLL